jgi:hypothetical protein
MATTRALLRSILTPNTADFSPVEKCGCPSLRYQERPLLIVVSAMPVALAAGWFSVVKLTLESDLPWMTLVKSRGTVSFAGSTSHVIPPGVAYRVRLRGHR